MKNPFQYGKVAQAENFIDRDADRKFLIQSLYSGNNVILMSPRRWGKSSLVRKAMEELKEAQPEVRVVHIDAFPITSSIEFYNVFTREVLRATASHTQAVLDNIGKFIKSISPKVSFSPEPMSEFSLSIDLSGGEIDPQEILNLPEKIAQERNLQIVVCIDEFQKLAKLPDYEKLESMMRSHWQHHTKVSYCLYGSQRHMMTDIFDSPEKPFYRFGQIYNLKKIAQADWVAYIQERFESTGKKISREKALWITDTAECHSWYVQQLASSVWNFTNTEASDKSLELGLEWIIDVNSESYHNITDQYTDAQIGLLKAILAEEEQLSAADTILKYRLGSSASVVKNKQAFALDDIISAPKREKPQFLDPIFKIWFARTYSPQ